MKKNFPTRKRTTLHNFSIPPVPKFKKSMHNLQVDHGEKRKLKRKVKFYLFILIFLCISALAGIIGFFLFRKINVPFIIPVESKQIVKPIEASATIEDFESILKKSVISYKSVSYSPDGNYIILLLSEDTEVIFTPQTDPVYQVSSLQSLLKRLTIDSVSKGSDLRFINKPKKIDFRYNKPIVVF